MKNCTCSQRDSYGKVPYHVGKAGMTTPPYCAGKTGMSSCMCMLLDVLTWYRVPEPLTKKIIWQTLHAVDFCHQHNVRRHLLLWQ